MRRILRMSTAFALTAGIVLSILSVAAEAQTPVTDEADMKVLSYNIKHGRGNDACANPPATPEAIPPMECEVDLERIANVISASGAEIVGLQEVDRFWARSGNVDQPTVLADLLGMQACYGPNLDHEADTHSSEPHQYGTLILTSHRIIDCTNVSLTTTEGWEQRGALIATLDLGDAQPLTVINTHLQAGREGEEDEAVSQRTQQLLEVLELASTVQGPVVIMGDLNATPDAAEMASILNADSGFGDAWAMANGDAAGLTIPASPDEEPTARIDYIFVSEGIQVTEATVIDTEETRLASDHFPLLVGIEVIEPAAPVATPVT